LHRDDEVVGQREGMGYGRAYASTRGHARDNERVDSEKREHAGQLSSEERARLGLHYDGVTGEWPNFRHDLMALGVPGKASVDGIHLVREAAGRDETAWSEILRRVKDGEARRTGGGEQVGDGMRRRETGLGTRVRVLGLREVSA